MLAPTPECCGRMAVSAETIWPTNGTARFQVGKHWAWKCGCLPGTMLPTGSHHVTSTFATGRLWDSGYGMHGCLQIGTQRIVGTLVVRRSCNSGHCMHHGQNTCGTSRSCNSRHGMHDGPESLSRVRTSIDGYCLMGRLV